MRTIKTYANGRFYDTLNKGYMSKDQLVALINKKEAINKELAKIGKQYQSMRLGWLESDIKNAKAVLGQFIDKRDLNKLEGFKHYIDAYNKTFLSELTIATIEEYGSRDEKSPLIEDKFNWEYYTDAINYCLVRFFMSPLSRELLFKCHNCGKYFTFHQPFPNPKSH